MLNNNVCAVVTTFKPGPFFLDNLKVLSLQVAFVIVVDDSGNRNIPIISQISNLELMYNKVNSGIAYSLNVGANRAIELGYCYLLTMDDDTKLMSNYVASLLSYLIKESNNTGIVIGSFTHQKSRAKSSVEIKNVVITSGALFSCKTYKMVGGFSDEMFIDYVDFDFCMRVRKNNLKIMKLNDVVYEHSIGVLKKKRILGIGISSFNHAPFRVYYQMRNVVYMIKTHFYDYPLYVIYIAKMSVSLPIKIILVDDDKIMKFKMYFKGLVDGIRGKGGRLN